jgi:predicted transcriptional regulator
MERLPDAEFEIMKVAWANEPPITTNMIMEGLGSKKKWKAPTVISLMSRLVRRGFLRTEKRGKERLYFPLVTKEEYLAFETEHFMKTVHESSFLSLVNTLYSGRQISERDLEEMLDWLKGKKD